MTATGWDGRGDDDRELDERRRDAERRAASPADEQYEDDTGAVPVAALRRLLAELDGWPARPTNFGDARDRLSHRIAAHGGEGGR